MTKPFLVAVDPGVNGGIAYFHHGEGVVTVHKMPGTDYEVCQLLADISIKAREVELFLEEPPLFAGKGIPGSAIGKLMWNTGILYGAAPWAGRSTASVPPSG